ncbi:hypothetical protein [Tenacibaculum sp. nBUS_03]|uniref:hypothetical protein n=1 Tax=Tenacibaculum sp. nBUS_03 TaxID=3395320 RepID=UPI003EB9467D
MKTFEEINKELKLENTSDWGIINYDSNRVREFINYYNENIISIDKPTKVEFIDLIISSMNQALIEDKVNNELISLFSEYLHSIETTKLNLMILENWASYESTEVDPFPVADLIKTLICIE